MLNKYHFKNLIEGYQASGYNYVYFKKLMFSFWNPVLQMDTLLTSSLLSKQIINCSSGLGVVYGF